MNSNIPIIALTADVTSVDVEKCKSIGMNDYISKPIDDKKLYNVIMKYIQLPDKQMEHLKDVEFRTPAKYYSGTVNLDYLKELTNSEPAGMAIMIKAYLEETPKLILAMKQGIKIKDWKAVGSAAHSILPSFSMLGMNSEYEKMASQIQEYTEKKENSKKVKELFFKIENVCTNAMVILEDELNAIEKQ